MSQGSSGRAAPTAHLATRSTKTYIGNTTKDHASAHYGDNFNQHYGDNITYHFRGPTAEQCLHDLRETDPREDRARIEGEKDKLLPDCYTWILDDANFQRWKTQDKSRLLWIKGDPGKGKTMMTMGVIAELSRGYKIKLSSRTIEKVVARLKPGFLPCLVIYFFCQSTRPQLNNAASVLRGLIYLLVAQRPQLMRHLQTRYKATGGKLFEGPNAIHALRDILSDMLNDASLPLTYVLVDALDECTSGLPELLRIITDASLGRRPRVKWLVTSRDIPEIARYLQPDAAGVKVSLEVKASHVSRAVAVFVQYKVQQLAIIHAYDLELQAEVQQQLRNKAEGTFLWVSLVCKELERVPLYCTQKALQILPPGLDPLYERMMKQIVGQDEKTTKYCKDILRSIALAFRPLQLRELAVAAGLPRDQFSDVQTVADLVSRCGSFLTIREGIVSFIHLSAKDFFTIGSGRQVFSGLLEKEQEQITYRLLDAMDSNLRRDMCNLQKPGMRIQEALRHVQGSCLPQIAYACEYWVEHLQAGGHACSDILVDGGKVYSFLQKHLLYWLEAISLLQKMPQAILALQKLEQVLNSVEGTIVLDIVQSALRFVMWSGSGIQEAPLQVYYGALVFAPEQSIVRRQFKKEIPKEVQVKCGLEEDWGPLLQTLEGHTSYVTSVAFSPAGDWLASASWDQTVRVWDAKTGQPLHTLQGHTNDVTSVAFSPAGDLLVSASDDKTVRVWDAKTGQLLQKLEGHTSYITSVAVSAAGDQLASASYDKTVRVWNAKTGQLLQKLEGHIDGVRSVAFSPVGDRLASASWDQTVRVWDAKTGQPLHILQGHAGYVTSVAFSPAGDRLASASRDKTVRVWDAKTSQPLHTLRGHTSYVTSVAFSPAGDRLVSASDDKTVRLWDAKTGQLLQKLEGYTNDVTSVAFSSDGAHIQTDQGLIPLSSSAPSRTTSQWHLSRRIFIKKRWLAVNSENMLWLPPNYVPSLTAIQGSLAAFGFVSGRMLLLRVDLEWK